jgi:integrase
MARRIQNIKLDTRTSRDKLSKSTNPYWTRIERNAHLGYRKGVKSGYWICRIRIDQGFKMKTLGTADDILDADGVEILDFFQAQDKSRKWFEQIIRIEKGIGIAKYTVNDALEDYLDYLETHGKSVERVRYAVDAYIRKEFGHVIVSELTSKKISDWHKKLIEEKPRKRSKKGKISFNDDAVKEDDYKRKRKNSANRILTSMKAALNKAYNEGKVSSDDAWRRVKPYRNVDTARIEFLRLNECGRVVNACDKDFRKMVQSALLTGCRYGELTKMRIKDYNSDIGTLYISESKTGKPRHIALEDQGVRFFNRHIIGKNMNDYMFTREDGGQWGRSHQTRRLEEACQKASLGRKISFHILRHTHASQLVQRGVPMAVIAAQLGNSVRICEKHYAHLSPSYISETIRAHFPDMQIVEEDNVVSIDKK